MSPPTSGVGGGSGLPLQILRSHPPFFAPWALHRNRSNFCATKIYFLGKFDALQPSFFLYTLNIIFQEASVLRARLGWWGPRADFFLRKIRSLEVSAWAGTESPKIDHGWGVCMGRQPRAKK